MSHPKDISTQSALRAIRVSFLEGTTKIKIGLEFYQPLFYIKNCTKLCIQRFSSNFDHPTLVTFTGPVGSDFLLSGYQLILRRFLESMGW